MARSLSADPPASSPSAILRKEDQPALDFRGSRLATRRSLVTRLLHFPATIVAVKPTIFVVEDDPDISRLVRHHLESASFNVRLYSTGNVVVSDAERQRPALFLLDIMVPGKDGLELCRQIRQSVSLASVPVIFLTAKSGEADRILGLELGADDYIPKPFSPRELVARVKAVLRRFERPLAASAHQDRGGAHRSRRDDANRSRQASSDHGHRIPPARLLSCGMPVAFSPATSCSIRSGVTQPT